jgi:hypothetical protein
MIESAVENIQTDNPRPFRLVSREYRSRCWNGSPIITEGKLTTPGEKSSTAWVGLYVSAYLLLGFVSFLVLWGIDANKPVSRNQIFNRRRTRSHYCMAIILRESARLELV